MARYRKVEVGMWRDDKFLALSNNGRMLWVYLLTGPRTTIFPGLVVATAAVMADDLGWTPEAFGEAFGEALREGLVKASGKGGLVVLKKALLDSAGTPRDTARPESPNVLRSWAKQWDEIPDCELKYEYLRTLGSFAEGLGVPFAKAFGEAFAKALAKASPHPSPNQDQDQDLHTHLPSSGFSQLSSDRAIPPAPTPAPTRSTVPATRSAWSDRQRWWVAMLDAHRRLRDSGLEPNAPNFAASPSGENEKNMAVCERGLREGGFDHATVDAKMLHVVLVAEAEARRDGSLKHFKPATLWKPEVFNFLVDTTLDQVRQPKQSRAGPQSVGPTAIMLEELHRLEQLEVTKGKK